MHQKCRSPNTDLDKTYLQHEKRKMQNTDLDKNLLCLWPELLCGMDGPYGIESYRVSWFQLQSTFKADKRALQMTLYPQLGRL